MKFKLPPIVLLLLGLWTPCSWAQEDHNLLQARKTEKVLGNPIEALKLYLSIKDSPTASIEDRDQALAGEIRCLLRLGREEEARALFSQATEDFVSGPHATELSWIFDGAQEGGDSELDITKERIATLIATMKDDSSARFKLFKLGDLAVPQIVSAIRYSRDSTHVSQSSSLLGSLLETSPNSLAIDYFKNLDKELDVFAIASGLSALHRVDPVPESLHTVIKKLSESDIPMIRSAVLELMAAIGETEFVMSNLQSTDPDIAIEAFESLENRAPSLVVDSAKRLLESKTEIRRIDVVIEPLLEAEARAVLRSALNHPNLDSRLALWERLEKSYPSKAYRSSSKQEFTSLLQPNPEQASELCRSFVELAVAFGDDKAFRFLDRMQDWSFSIEQVETLRALSERRANMLDSHLVRSLDLNGDDTSWVDTYGAIVWWYDDGTSNNRIEIARKILKQAGLMSSLGLTVTVDLIKSVDPKAAVVIRECAESLDWHIDDWALALGGHSTAVPLNSTLITKLLDAQPKSTEVLLHLVKNIKTEELLLKTGMLDRIGEIPTSDPVRVDVWSAAIDHPNAKFREGLHKQLSKDKLLPADIAFKLATAIADVSQRNTILARSLIQTGQDPLGMARRCITTLSDVLLLRGILSRMPEIVEEAPELTSEVRELIYEHWDLNPYSSWYVLVSLPNNSTEDFRKGIRACLSDKGSEALVNIIAWIVKNKRADMTDEIVTILNSEFAKQSAKLSAINALVYFGDMDSAPILVSHLTDSDSTVRAAAANALETLRRYLEEKERWSDIQENGTPLNAMQALVKQSKIENLEIRLAAIKSLGTLGDPEALPHLIGMLQDDNDAVKKAAREAIAKLNK